jgi:hypothetical protein
MKEEAMTLRRAMTAMGFASAMVLMASPGLADAIDGDWCFRDGKHFEIRGPQITTPGGTRMSGQYDRHHFSYVVPGNEANAGQTVQMTLVNEQTVHLRVAAAGSSDAPPQVWQRCTPRTSSLKLSLPVG